jgi:uncharacterized protein (TIGR00255 family)
MIRSMTGFGKAQVALADKKLTIEIKSLNSKQFDLSLRLPSFLKEKESEFRGVLSKEVERGKTECSVSLEAGMDKPVSINRELFKFYYSELHAISKELGADTEGLFRVTAGMPDVIRPEREELSDEVWEAVQQGLERAIADFNGFREKEGRSLEVDLCNRLAGISQNLIEIASLDKGRTDKIRDRIVSKLKDLTTDQKVDNNRLEQEMVFYVEKLDINEEKVRLASHCQYFEDTLKEKSAQGRKLGFITQEMGREINTIGSKANDAAIQQLVVLMKDDLEKIKEQLNNVL